MSSLNGIAVKQLNWQAVFGATPNADCLAQANGLGTMPNIHG